MSSAWVLVYEWITANMLAGAEQAAPTAPAAPTTPTTPRAGYAGPRVERPRDTPPRPSPLHERVR